MSERATSEFGIELRISSRDTYLQALLRGINGFAPRLLGRPIDGDCHNTRQ